MSKVELRNCIDCNQSFTLEEGEIKFFQQKKLELPKRCKPCRRIKNPTKWQPKDNA